MRNDLCTNAAALPQTGDDTPVGLDQVIRFGLTGADWFPYLLRYKEPLEAAWLQILGADKWVLLADANLPAWMVDGVRGQLAAVAPCALIRVAGSEDTKHLGLVDRLAAETVAAGATRRSVLAVMGGGLLGNAAGLLAALYLRGAVGELRLPTTLLAMSDSTLSLKDAVSVPGLAKNIIGTFSAPAMVWADLGWLDGLHASQTISALCEIIKNTLAIRPGDTDEVAALADAAPSLSPRRLQRVIELGIAAKTQVMRADPTERRDGLVLELGHTTGHAVELLTHGGIPHGHAIGTGLCVAAEISHHLGLLDRDAVELHYELLSRLGAPTRLPATVTPEAVVEVIRHDNKRGYLDPKPGHHQMVLLADLGVPLLGADGLPLVQVAEADLLAGLRATSDSAHGRPVPATT